jgi:hypothetical protein
LSRWKTKVSKKMFFKVHCEINFTACVNLTIESNKKMRRFLLYKINCPARNETSLTINLVLKIITFFA